MIQITDKENCCGCTSCANVCTHQAISMIPDDLGFLYPHVNATLCTNCGLCDSVCSFQNGYDTGLNLKVVPVFAVRHKDIKELRSSRSGAAFIAISDYILENGGVVYGAGYNQLFRVIHKRAKDKGERNEFKGSKYVQSDLGDTFLNVREDLKAGLKVLFSGTPCQTAGLRSYIGKKYISSLYLVDIICHGVPSPYIWKDYLMYLEKEYNRKIVKVNFRDKTVGWTVHKESFLFENGKTRMYSVYTDLFYKNIMLRPCCGKCKYTNIVRPSDITIGDFWGWEKIDSLFNKDNLGCSLVIINTEKGKELFENQLDKMEYRETNISECLQPNLERPTQLSMLSVLFYDDYKNRGFLYIMKKYGSLGFLNRAKFLLKKILKK